MLQYSLLTCLIKLCISLAFPSCACVKPHNRIRCETQGFTICQVHTNTEPNGQTPSSAALFIPHPQKNRTVQFLHCIQTSVGLNRAKVSKCRKNRPILALFTFYHKLNMGSGPTGVTTETGRGSIQH